jgi:hypothetical protein
MARKKDDDKNIKTPKRKRGRPPGNKNKNQYNDLLKTGKLAKVKIYQDFVTRIAQGESLKPSEIKIFHAIENEIEESINGGPADKKIITSFKLAASYCGVSTRTISYHLKRGNIKQNDDGTFEKSILDKWLIKSGRKTKPGAAGKSIDEKKESADLRIKEAKAAREEMLLEQVRGNLLSKDEVFELWAKRVNFVKMGLLNFQDRLPPMVEGKTRKQIARILAIEIVELLKSYTVKGKYTPEIKN